MTEPSQQGEMPSVIVTKKRRLSAVWIAPVLAAFAVGYMVYDGLRSRGPMISITFENAEGIVAGKSPLKFEGVQIGTVEGVEADLRTGRLTLRSRLDASARELAVEGSQFWIQTPEIGLSGVASLDTLISGPYIACLTGTGAPATEFEGLAKRPPTPASRPGLRLSLRADVVVALRPGSPVLCRGVAVGTVDRIDLPAAEDHVVVDVFIDEDHASLVRGDSAFWEVSGVKMGFDPGDGLVLDTESLQSLATGGIAFHSGPAVEPGARVADGTTFTLQRHPGISWNPAYLHEAGALDTGDMLNHLASILRKADTIDVTETVAALRELSDLATRALDTLDESGVVRSTVDAMDELRLASAEANRTLEGVSRLVERDGDLDQAVANLGAMARQLESAAARVGVVLDDIEERDTIEHADRLITQLEAAAPDLVQAMADLGDTLERIDALVRTNDRPLADTIRALRGASLRLEALLEDLRANPSQLLSEPPSRKLPRSSP
jgi:paraquat-inducible protein B